MTLVGVFALADRAFRGRIVREFSFFIGRISYSVYLFHIIVVMTLKPKIASWPLAAQLALYCFLICSFSAIFWSGFERPILAARPQYRAHRSDIPVAICIPAARTSWISSLGGFDCARSCGPWRSGDRPQRLYGEQAIYILRPACGDSGPDYGARRKSPFAASARAWNRQRGRFSCSRSHCRLPISHSGPRPGLPSRRPRRLNRPILIERRIENPTAFAMWWFDHLNEWISRGRHPPFNRNAGPAA